MKKQNSIIKEELINKYIDDCLKDAVEYENQVLNDEIVVSKWIKKAVIREQKLRKKYIYNTDKVKEVFRFLYFINIEPKKQFKPLPFQSWIILSIYSLYKENDRRLRKFGIIWIARKNGKTAFTAVLSLYELIKGEAEAEVYFLATTAKQAAQGLKYLKAIIEYSPALKKRVDVLQYNLRFNKHSILKPLANNPNKLDGLNPSFSVLDRILSN